MQEHEGRGEVAFDADDGRTLCASERQDHDLRQGLPEGLEESIYEVEDKTKDNKGTILNIAFNYGGQEDILHAAEWCYLHGDFSKEKFEKALGTSHLPPLDCIVRTAGEMRLSNFLLYECAYAELIFLAKAWPDMDAEDVDKIIELYSERIRKFGK